MNREAIFRHIDDHIDDHVAHIQRWVRQRSVSWDNLGVDDCAELVAASYRHLGCREVEIIPGRFHQGVWAGWPMPAIWTVSSCRPTAAALASSRSKAAPAMIICYAASCLACGRVASTKRPSTGCWWKTRRASSRSTPAERGAG